MFPVVCRRDALIATLLARVDELAVRVAALEVENATLREPPNNGGNYFAFDADTRTLHHRLASDRRLSCIA